MINILYLDVSGTPWVFHCLLPLPPENLGYCSCFPASGLSQSLPLSLLQRFFSTTQDTATHCPYPQPPHLSPTLRLGDS